MGAQFFDGSGDNTVSTGNSTTSNLAISGVFTGTGEDVLAYGTLIVSVFSNVALTFTVQWSNDNTNWRADGDVYTVTAGILKAVTYGPKLQYFRVVVTNGATGTTTFFVSTVYKVGHTKPSSHMISEAINDSADAELVKAVISGRKADGTYANVDITGNGDIGVADVSDSGGVHAALTVGTSAVLACVSGTNLTNRKTLTIHNNSLLTIYWGYANTVTTSTGTPIAAGQFVSWAVGPNTNVYLITTLVSQNTRVTESA